MRVHLLSVVAILGIGIGLVSTAQAQTSLCNALQGEKRALADKILRSQHPYDCCDDTIHACLQQKPVCRLARRLADDVCKRVAAGQGQTEIERALTKRAISMTTQRKVPIDTSRFEPAGAANAKVQLVAYVCTKCPYCSRLMPELYRLVTEGPLKDKVQLHVRLFPIRGHAGSTEGGLALVAAQRMGKFWPFLLHLYRVMDRVEPAKLPECAAKNGMDRAEFSKVLEDPATRANLTESKREGVRNDVDATPTLFLNGRKFSGDLDVAYVQDALEEEYERVTGKNKD